MENKEDYYEIRIWNGDYCNTRHAVSAFAAAAGVIFLATNIPTAVFGGIWLHYKGRRDTMEDLKRMRIEDLG